MLSTNVQLFAPSTKLHLSALNWAHKINQSKAYDAQYLALAEQEDAHFWSADKRLVNGAQQTGIDWIHWIAEASSTIPQTPA